MTHEQATFDAKTEIDFVIIGAGAAGASLPKNYPQPDFASWCSNKART